MGDYVREAEYQFEQQKQVLEKESVFRFRRTQLYGQEMGLQNSQQMVGLVLAIRCVLILLLNQI